MLKHTRNLIESASPAGLSVEFATDSDCRPGRWLFFEPRWRPSYTMHVSLLGAAGCPAVRASVASDLVGHAEERVRSEIADEGVDVGLPP